VVRVSLSIATSEAEGRWPNTRLTKGMVCFSISSKIDKAGILDKKAMKK